MSKDDRNPISVIALRADDYSPDGRFVIISLTTKFSETERVYAVPVECLHDLVLDLQRLNAAGRATSIEAHIQSTDTAEDLSEPTATEVV